MHIPVLFDQVINAINPQDGQNIIDATFGGGGHTRGILDSANCNVYAIDRDKEAGDRASQLIDQYNGRLFFHHGQFADLSSILSQYNIKFDAILFDFGVSSYQLDQAERGFSFMRDGPLDMRMNGMQDCQTAHDIVNNYDEDQLSQILFVYGDERLSRQIAKAIVLARKTKYSECGISRTHQLRDIIHSVYKTNKIHGIDVATKTFQAIRIYVNDELRQIQDVLNSLQYIMKNEASLVTISFHYLEDRIVKNWASSHRNQNESGIIVKQIGGTIKPTNQEIKSNVRSRSAIMRHYKIHIL